MIRVILDDETVVEGQDERAILLRMQQLAGDPTLAKYKTGAIHRLRNLGIDIEARNPREFLSRLEKAGLIQVVRDGDPTRYVEIIRLSAERLWGGDLTAAWRWFLPRLRLSPHEVRQIESDLAETRTT